MMRIESGTASTCNAMFVQLAPRLVGPVAYRGVVMVTARSRQPGGGGRPG